MYFKLTCKILRGETLSQPWPNAFGMRMKFSGNYALSSDAVPKSIEDQKKGLHRKLKRFCPLNRVKTKKRALNRNLMLYSSITIRGERINRTHVTKYLGLLIDEKLKFDVHVKHVCKKLSLICGIFCYLRQYIGQKTLLMLYYSLVNSHLWNLSTGFNKSFNLAAIASPLK